MISVGWLNTGGLSEADERRWAELASSAAAPNPFYELGFVRPALEHFGRRDLDLLVATDGAGDWVGLMPFERPQRWRHLIGAALTPWQHPHCFLDSPLLARDCDESALEALLHHARQEAGLIAFDRLPAEGPAASALNSACDALGVKPVVWQRSERAALRRRPEDDYVRSSLSSKHFRELGRKGRKLEGEVGEVAVLDRADDPLAVDDLLALEASGWKGDEGTALAAGPGAAFFRSVCTEFARAGRLQMLALQAGDRTIAVQSALIAGEGMFCFKITYDEALARFSPGTRLMAETASEFHRRPELQWADSCSKPGSEPVERLWPDRRRLATVLIPGAGAKGGALSFEARLAARLRAALRSNGHAEEPSTPRRSNQPA